MDSNEFKAILNDYKNKKNNNALEPLSTYVNSYGLPQCWLEEVSDLAVLPLLPTLHQNQILRTILIPCYDYLLPKSLFNKILASIRPSEVHFRNGKECKPRRLQQEGQSTILRWLLQKLPYFGSSIFKTIRSSFPILLKLLSYYDTRRYIIALIVYGAFDLGDNPTNFKSWHEEMVSELLEAVPCDLSIVFLQWCMGISDRLPSDEANVALERPSSDDIDFFLEIPDEGFVAADSASSNNNVIAEVMAVSAKMESVRGFLHSQLENRKRPKPLSEENTSKGIESIENIESVVKVQTASPMRNIIDNFERIDTQCLKVFSRNEKMESSPDNVHMVLSLLNSPDSPLLLRRAAAGLSCAQFPDNQSSELFAQIASHGMLSISYSICELLLNSEKLSTHGLESKTCLQVRAIPYLNIETYNKQILFLTQNEERLLSENLIALFFANISIFYGKYAFQESNSNGTQIESLLSCLPTLFEIASKVWLTMGLHSQLNFIKVLRSLCQFELSSELPTNISNLVPPPVLMYQLLLSTNPLIASEALMFVSFLKKVKFTEKDQHLKTTINSYIYDGVNFFWKDDAFKCEDDIFSKGMYLHPDFILRMGSLNFFGSSELLQPRTVGNLARNPAFAYLFAEIVWSLEDADEEISVRRPGPLSDDFGFHTQNDLNELSMNMSYKDLKTKALDILAESGFRGMSHFLFTTVRSLKNLRLSE